MSITRLCQLLAAVLFLSCLAFAQSKSAKDYADSAEKKADASDYEGAIQDYDQALAVETNDRRKRAYEKDLEKIKQRYYRHLVDGAAILSSRQAKIKLLSRARRLEIENTEGKLGGRLGFGGKDFSEIVAEGKKARQQIISELGREIEQEADQKNFTVALFLYEEAKSLDPEESRGLAKIKDQIDQQMKRGEQLAEEAWQALEAKEHKLAKDRLNEAKQIFPGQDRVQEGLNQIEKDVSEYRRSKSQAEGLVRANPAGSVDAYQAALDVHPELGRADKLPERIRNLQLRIEKDKAWDAYKSEDYIRSQQLFEELLLRHPNDEEVRLGRDQTISRLKLLEGKRLSEDGRYQNARKLFQEALELDSGNGEAEQLLARDDQYLNQVAEGRRLFQRSQKEGTPEDCQQSIIHFREARKLNADRFGKERMDSLVDEGDCQSVIPLPFELLTAGLDSYLDGKPSDAIEALEAALDEVGEGRVEVHALLGAAYCFSGLLQGTQDSANLEKGREQFRLALKADSEYRLSESLFSPQIRRIFEEVRAELQAAENEPSQQAPNRPDNR